MQQFKPGWQSPLALAVPKGAVKRSKIKLRGNSHYTSPRTALRTILSSKQSEQSDYKVIAWIVET